MIADWTTCPADGKRTYNSRRDARKAGKSTKGRGMNAYECPSGSGWHVGHLPARVVQGRIGRDSLPGGA